MVRLVLQSPQPDPRLGIIGMVHMVQSIYVIGFLFRHLQVMQQKIVVFNGTLYTTGGMTKFQHQSSSNKNSVSGAAAMPSFELQLGRSESVTRNKINLITNSAILPSVVEIQSQS